LAKLTLTVVTLNEERNLPRCLSSAEHLVDEIVVVDSGSTDRTEEVAAAFGAHFLVNPWPGHKEQKQLAVDRASHDWILSLDADEWITPELEVEIQRLMEGEPAPASYSINRITKFMGRFMRHCWQPDWNCRLFHRSVAYWGGVNPHDHVHRFDEQPHQELKQPFYHDSYQNLRQYLDRFNSYTSIAAEAPEAKRYRLSRLVFSPIAGFLKNYFLKGGFREGVHGFILSVYAAMYGFTKYAKLWERTLPPPERDPGGPFPELEDVLVRGDEPPPAYD
jgi:glycosyltransferase involved in cell wall biosynthesis